MPKQTTMPTTELPLPPQTQARMEQLLTAHQRAIWIRTDRLFAALLVCEWCAGVIIASVRSPWTYDGAVRSIHPNMWAATVLAGIFVSLPIMLAFLRPGFQSTRQCVAVSQMLITALLIHLGDGRIEMHFLAFGSFAFLAFYRDWRVLVTGTLIIASDHLLRGFLTPYSVYGVAYATGWRTLEHASWVIFENIFLIVSCVQSVREMRGIARNRALLEHSYREVEQKVQERTQQLKDAQDGLLKAARTAGMAEIATSVLHNVGNVLNSVNVSATVVVDKLRHSDVPSLARVSDLIGQHKDDLGTYLTADERGKMIPDFIAELANCLHDEQETLINEVTSLTKGIDHIKQIVAAQQSMAKKSNVRTRVEPSRVLETALSMQSASMNSELVIERDFAVSDPIELDEHKVLQILINLISNARQAVAARGGSRKQIGLRIAKRRDENGVEWLRFCVADNGVGIASENLNNIFRHGFTTKKDGHGFGLHSAANAAREMGGDLSVASEGVGKGATFTLELPMSPPAPTENDAAVESTLQENA